MPLPRTLVEAVEAFAADPVVTAALDAAGAPGQVSAHYRDLKTAEFFAWHDTVSPWEVDRYLTAV